MYRHSASCLGGPVSWARSWWHIRAHAAESATPSEDPKQTGDIRTELVERVRREIAVGTYDTPEKLEIALDRLLRRLLHE